jgi:anaerobic selenocysteine-containing dehydrogenase
VADRFESDRLGRVAAWQRCSAGRPCDYTGISYAALRANGGIQWGGERLYVDGAFRASPDDCESYGRDLVTAASVEETEYRALNPDGKAIIKAAEFFPLHEDASSEYPFQLITGRTIYHFHTRTKTARAPELDAAAPEVWAPASTAWRAGPATTSAPVCRQPWLGQDREANPARRPR